jgi:hypothetical protein
MTIELPSRMLAAFYAAAMLLSLTPAAYAHGEKAKPHAHAAEHGGQYVEIDGHHGVEMVATDKQLTFHLTEEDKPVDLGGASFKALVQSDAGTKVYPLAVAGSSLVGTIDGAIPKGARVALTGKDRHGHALQARFVKE